MLIGIENIDAYLKGLEGWRGTKKELELKLSDYFEKKIKLSDCTKDCCTPDNDYLLSGNLIGDGKKDERFGYDGYVDLDVYYLKMREKGHIYITEILVHWL